jgi:hypothetical protein
MPGLCSKARPGTATGCQGGSKPTGDTVSLASWGSGASRASTLGPDPATGKRINPEGREPSARLPVAWRSPVASAIYHQMERHRGPSPTDPGAAAPPALGGPTDDSTGKLIGRPVCINSNGAGSPRLSTGDRCFYDHHGTVDVTTVVTIVVTATILRWRPSIVCPRCASFRACAGRADLHRTNQRAISVPREGHAGRNTRLAWMSQSSAVGWC